MRPCLRDGRFVFSTVARLPHDLPVVAMIREDEGLSIVVEQDRADLLGLGYDFVAAMITLRVHSSLEAVGLTAAVATALARAGISCNVVAGNQHDHLFVPAERAGEALHVLEELAAGRP